MLKSAILLACTLCVEPAFPQMMGMGMRPPEITGMFHPVVGSGAEYHVATAGQPNADFAFVIVGKETDGYWMEIRTVANGNAVVMKQLMSIGENGQTPQIKRMIMQANGRPPMELPAGMLNGAMGRGVAQSGAPRGDLGAKI